MPKAAILKSWELAVRFTCITLLSILPTLRDSCVPKNDDLIRNYGCSFASRLNFNKKCN
jgi:hypothetical protein